MVGAGRSLLLDANLGFLIRVNLKAEPLILLDASNEVAEKLGLAFAAQRGKLECARKHDLLVEPVKPVGLQACQSERQRNSTRNQSRSALLCSVFSPGLSE